VRTVVSTGPGRLHLFLTAAALLECGEDVRVVTGWIPGPALLRAAAAAARWRRGGNLPARLNARAACDGFPRDRVVSCSLADGLGALVQRGAPDGPWASRARRWAWQRFGRASRRYLRDADVFHVRSGAGRGGAIAVARRRGMVVVADHSIAHPRWMASVLTDEYAKYGAPCPFRSDDPFWNLVERDCGEADVILVNSQFVADTFVEQGFSAESLRVAYLGVSREWSGLKRSYAAGGRLHVVFIGEFGVRKGAGYLLDALETLDPHRRRFALTVIGGHAEVPLLARRHRIAPEDRLLGFVDAAAVRRHLASADMFVFPSLAEGCAKAAMEAMAAGVPVIATRETGLPTLSGEHSLLVESRSVKALGEAMAMLADDENLRARIGRAGERLVTESYSWQRYGEQVSGIHASLLQGVTYV